VAVGFGIGVFTLIVYLVTLSPTINFVDSGQLIAVGYTAGVAHPPGYPLYTLLCIVAAHLPFGSPAVNVNAISAIAGGVAAGLFYAFVYEVLAHHIGRNRRGGAVAVSVSAGPVPGKSRAAGRKGEGGVGRQQQPDGGEVSGHVGGREEGDAILVSSAAGAALILAFSFLFWNWSTQAKMYTLHFAFASALLWMAMRARRALQEARIEGRPQVWPVRAWPHSARLLLGVALVLGFSLTNHYMTFLLLPGLAVLLLWPEHGGQTPGEGIAPRWREIGRYALILVPAALAPLLLYLYLPLRASQQPVLNWGTPDNWDDFWRHVTVWQFRPYVGAAGSPFSFLGEAYGYALDQLGAGLGVVVVLFATVGVAHLFRANKALLAATAVIGMATLLYSLLYQLRGVAPYYVPMYMMVLAWVGVGFDRALRALGARLGAGASRGDLATRDARHSNGARRRGMGIQMALAGAPLLVALLAFGANVGRAGHANNYVAEAYVRNGFNNFAPNAVVLTNDYDFVSASYYLQYVLHERPDVAVISKDLLRYPFYLDYIDRQYGELLAPLKEIEERYKVEERAWVNGRTSEELGARYVEFLRGIIDRGMEAGRPVYLYWVADGGEEKAISQGLQAHPESLGLRVDRERYEGPLAEPGFDLRGILVDRVSLDELDFKIAALYPLILERMSAYASERNLPAEAARYADLARQVRVAIGLPPR
jgi:hypothetical protein